MNPLHSAKSSEHYTPPEVVGLAREVFGGPIDLDPASCEQANRIVQATTFYSREDNGLGMPWRGKRIFCNPPGGKQRHDDELVSEPALWWTRLALEVAREPQRQGFFVIFNLETARHVQGWEVSHPFLFPTCLPAKRLAYYRPGRGGPVRGKRPTHPSALVYLGPHREKFFRLFAPLGFCFQGIQGATP